MPQTYWHPEEKLLLVIYVDDMKMSGPESEMASAWAALGENIKLEEPKGDASDRTTFLGCTHVKFTETIDGVDLRCMAYDARASMKRGVAKYEEAVFGVTGKYPELRPVKTPFIVEETKHCPH